MWQIISHSSLVLHTWYTKFLFLQSDLIYCDACSLEYPEGNGHGHDRSLHLFITIQPTLALSIPLISFIPLPSLSQVFQHCLSNSSGAFLSPATSTPLLYIVILIRFFSILSLWSYHLRVCFDHLHHSTINSITITRRTKPSINILIVFTIHLLYTTTTFQITHFHCLDPKSLSFIALYRVSIIT